MRYLILLLILLPFASQAKPLHGHPFQNMNVSNFAREIDQDSQMILTKPEWVAVLEGQKIISGKGQLTLDKLRMVNDRVNSKQSFALSPWMTPEQFYSAKEADCKAYATTKYYELRAMGWKPEELNLWSGDYDGRSHLVLVARLGDKTYVLDILDQHMPEAKDYFYKHFIPSYRFNELGLDVN